MPSPETTGGSRRELRPGPGWRRLGGAVWEHPSGVCIHVAGLCCFRGVTINGRKWPESRELDRAIQVNGGNRKRGTMAWALAVARRELTLGPTRMLVPVLRVPWKFPYQAGIAGYREEANGDTRPLCVVTGERIERNPNG